MNIKEKMQEKALMATLDMFEGTLNKLPSYATVFLDSLMSDVELKEGEHASILIIGGESGYMVNVIRLDQDLKISEVKQKISLKDFFSNILNYIKDGGKDR